MEKTTFKALQTSEQDGKYLNNLVDKELPALEPEEVLVKVSYSSLNYKDALSASGNKGVTRNFPHTPGIDAVGFVYRSASADWKEGDAVIVTGFDLGMNTDGGFAEYVKVPGKWLLFLPENLSMRESMIYGTAGFTAALSVQALLKNGLKPEDGTIAVSGASGGVGSIATAILSKLGYSVAAVSSKEQSAEFLRSLGASEIIPRRELEDQSGKPLLKPRFAGAVDTVGGLVLSTLIRSTNYGGTVTACGMVNGGEIPLTVFPFILKGISLCGIDSVELPLEKRPELWNLMADEWKPAMLDSMASEITLEELPENITKILAGKMQGRAIVRI